MKFTKISKKLTPLIDKNSRFTDSIIQEIIIKNPDYVNEKNHIVFTKEGCTVEMKLVQQTRNGAKDKTITLHGVDGMKPLNISSFIIFEVAVGEKDDYLLFSITGGFGEKDSCFRTKGIEIE